MWVFPGEGRSLQDAETGSVARPAGGRKRHGVTPSIRRADLGPASAPACGGPSEQAAPAGGRRGAARAAAPASRLLRRTEAPHSRVRGPSRKLGLDAECGSFLHPQKKSPFAQNGTDPTFCSQEALRRLQNVTPGQGPEESAGLGVAARGTGRGPRGPELSELCLRNKDD